MNNLVNRVQVAFSHVSLSRTQHEVISMYALIQQSYVYLHVNVLTAQPASSLLRIDINILTEHVCIASTLIFKFLFLFFLFRFRTTCTTLYIIIYIHVHYKVYLFKQPCDSLTISFISCIKLYGIVLQFQLSPCLVLFVVQLYNLDSNCCAVFHFRVKKDESTNGQAKYASTSPVIHAATRSSRRRGSAGCYNAARAVW